MHEVKRSTHRYEYETNEILSNLCDELEKELGAFGFCWLCACAAYPVLRFYVSVYLGRRLADAGGRPPPNEDEHLALFRLPWFRVGWMPKDLRLALLQRLDPTMQSVVREAIETLLFNVPHYKQGDPAAALPGGITRDIIFVNYMLGHATSPLDLRRAQPVSWWINLKTLAVAMFAVGATIALWLLADRIIGWLIPLLPARSA